MENLLNKDEVDLLQNEVLKIKENEYKLETADKQGSVPINLFSNHNGEEHNKDDAETKNDKIESNNEEKENEEDLNLLNKLNDKEDVQMENDELECNKQNSNQTEQLDDSMMMEDESDELKKRQIRLRNDLYKRKLRHLENKKKIQKTEDESEEEYSEDENSPDSNNEQNSNDDSTKDINKNQNIVDLLNRNKTENESDIQENEEEDSLKKASAYLGLQRLLQLLQQQQQQQATENMNQENLQEIKSSPLNQENKNEQSDKQESQCNNQEHSESKNKDWLLNAASATFPLEKSQSEALAKQSPALLHQQLMMVQLLQQLQQQAANESKANEDEEDSEEQLESNKKHFDEQMECDQPTSSRFMYDKSKLNFGNLVTSALTTNTSTLSTGAPVPTRPAHTLNPISTSSSLYISSNPSINSQTNRLNSQNSNSNLPTTASTSTSTSKTNTIDNLILMPDDEPGCPSAQQPSKNPLELLQHTTEKALQQTMKGASFLVNGENDDEIRGDDPSSRHRCKFCDKVFGSNSALEIHIRSHTGSRPFKCNVCGNRFSTKGNLKVHFSRHQSKYPNVQMLQKPVPEYLDNSFPLLEPPGSSQSPPPQFQTSSQKDDLLGVNNLGLNFAQGLAAAAAASQQHSLAQQQQQQNQLQSIMANLSADNLESFSRDLLLGNSNNFQLLKNSSILNAAEKQLRESLKSRSPAAAKQKTVELEDSPIKDTILDNKQIGKKVAANDTMDVLLSDPKLNNNNIANHHQNQQISPNVSLNQQQRNLFGNLSSKENQPSDDSTINNIMLDYLFKSKQQQQQQQQQQQNRNKQQVKSQDNKNLEDQIDEKTSVNALLNELTQQQFNSTNNMAQMAAASAAASLFASFLPQNIQPNIYQQLPAYLSNLLQHQQSFSSQQLNHSNNSLNGLNNSSNNLHDMSTTANHQSTVQSTVANLLNQQSSNLNTLSPIGNNLDLNRNQSPSSHRNTSSPANKHLKSTHQQNLLGVLNNLNNLNNSTTNNRSPNSSLNSAHDFDLNSVLSSSPRSSPNIRQQLSQLAALASTSSNTNHSAHHLMQSPVHSLNNLNSSTPTPSQTSTGQQSTSLNAAYQDLLPKPGSTDNAWETLMEIEKDNEATKLKKLVENCDQKIIDPNQCMVCQRVLSCKSALHMHYRTHTGERPFKCRLCARAFTTKGNLKTHMSVHRQKPSLRSMHECPICRQQFTNALVLQQHVKQQHNKPDERQLIQAHQRAQQQLQYAAAMERMMLAVQHQKQTNGDGLNSLPPNFFADDPFFASLNPNFNLAQLQNSIDRQSLDESSFEQAIAAQLLNQNYKFLNDDSSSKQFDDEEFDEKEDDENLANNSKDDLDDEELGLDSSMANQDDDLCQEDEEMINFQKKQQHGETDTNRPVSLSPSQKSSQQTEKNEQVENMNEDSMGSSMSSSAGAIDLTPKQQQVVAAHLQQIRNIQLQQEQQQQEANQMNNLSESTDNQSTQSINQQQQQQLLNIPNMPTFQLSARGANTTCKICMKTFACNSALEIHYRSHTKERPFKCTICDRGFSTKGNCKQHLLTHKLQDFPPNILSPNLNVSKNNQLSSLMLNAAAAAFNNNSAVSNGQNHHSSPNNHSMPINDQLNEFASVTKSSELNGFKEKLDLAVVINSANGLNDNCLLKSSNASANNSLSKHHSNSSSRPNNLQQLQLNNGDCQSDISCEANELDDRHSVNSLNGQSFERSSSAANSGNESSSSSILNLANSNENVLKRMNNLTNSISSNLSTSLNTANGGIPSTSNGNTNGQTGELKHMCEICVKPFSSHSALQIHTRTHTGQKPFKCNICSRPFTTKGNLKVHMGTHYSVLQSTNMWSSNNTQSRRGRRMSIEMNFPNLMM